MIRVERKMRSFFLEKAGKGEEVKVKGKDGDERLGIVRKKQEVYVLDREFFFFLLKWQEAYV